MSGIERGLGAAAAWEVLTVTLRTTVWSVDPIPASLRRALELEGYQVELAADGREALYRLETESQPDAIVLDVLMPGVDGLEVARTIRRSGSRVPILMLTARTQVEDRVEGLDAGAD